MRWILHVLLRLVRMTAVFVTFILPAPGFLIHIEEIKSVLHLKYSPLLSAVLLTSIGLSSSYLFFIAAFGCVGGKRYPNLPIVAVIVLSLSIQYLKDDIKGSRHVPEFSAGKFTSQQYYNLTGTVTIVTGANSGIGYGIAQAIGAVGGEVILACRRPRACRDAAQKINDNDANFGGKAHFMTLDLASFESIKTFVTEYRTQFSKLNYLVNNAGFGFPKDDVTLTAEGFEIGFGSMHLGHFLLTQLLSDIMEKTVKDINSSSSSDSPTPRVVVVSSAASQYADSHNATFHPSLFVEDGEGDLRGEITTSASREMYFRAKLANVLFARELRKRHPVLKSCSFHPGAVSTSIFDGIAFGSPMALSLLHAYENLFMRSVEEGRRTGLKCLLSDEAGEGEYIDGIGTLLLNSDILSPSSRNDTLAARLWDVSERIVNDYNNP